MFFSHASSSRPNWRGTVAEDFAFMTVRQLVECHVQALTPTITNSIYFRGKNFLCNQS
jgi:hypothetical protein